jgi:hypothetical protein
MKAAAGDDVLADSHRIVDSLFRGIGDLFVTQIGRIEFGDFRQAVHIVDAQGIAVQAAQPLLARAPQGTIDVDETQTQGIAENFLGDGHLVLEPVGLFDRIQPMEEFEQHMGDPLEGATPADADDLLLQE